MSTEFHRFICTNMHKQRQQQQHTWKKHFRLYKMYKMQKAQEMISIWAEKWIECNAMSLSNCTDISSHMHRIYTCSNLTRDTMNFTVQSTDITNAPVKSVLRLIIIKLYDLTHLDSNRWRYQRDTYQQTTSEHRNARTMNVYTQIVINKFYAFQQRK